MTHVVTLTSRYHRDRAHGLIERAPDGYVMTIAEPKRTGEQNDKLWAMLTDISVQKPMGRRHTPDDWKALAMNACGWDCQFVEGLDGRPFPIGFRSSRLTKSQMSNLIEWLYAFGADHGIRWSEPEKGA